jgi:hypothetical protein
VRLNEAAKKMGDKVKGRLEKKRKVDTSYEDTRDEERKVKWYREEGMRKDEEEGEEDG